MYRFLVALLAISFLCFDSEGWRLKETCEDGILNEDEEWTDCGGSCPACPDEFFYMRSDIREEQWSSCSKCFGNGIQIREGSILSKGANGDSGSMPRTQTKLCNTHKKAEYCDQDYVLKNYEFNYYPESYDYDYYERPQDAIFA